ncbi:pyridoxamine 5'-phosphate oxidase family protein [Nocardioides sp.]|uniref:pyridoxamine 5'-phosphate oxidase family protein n=1 Tax=Nocardioides sp. TaxID=35761 RepID=UPI0027357E86|nr:pyridoxamine 5'-phosphate oxidase family protein [Nocardioides sp.]MDP3889616.1 pyridoxamine 5'-phosphate oxidase family protein [Nocardioides sp.]
MNEPTEMPYDTCLELLTGGVVGRLGVCTPAGPQIIPVNYAVIDNAVVFRTSPYGVLAGHAWDRPLAFEVDHIDYERHRGWSVLATGPGARIEDPDHVEEVRALRDPKPWAGGTRDLYVRLHWEELTGRRLGTGWTHANEMPVRRI